MDGAQALATGGNFYELRKWGDAEWKAARDCHRGAERARQGLASAEVSRIPISEGNRRHVRQSI